MLAIIPHLVLILLLTFVLLAVVAASQGAINPSAKPIGAGAEVV